MLIALSFSILVNLFIHHGSTEAPILNPLIISSVVPQKIPRRTSKTLEILLDRPLALEENLLCEFRFPSWVYGSPELTNATQEANKVSCRTPNLGLLPYINHERHYLVAKLSLKTLDGPDLASAPLLFYECSTYWSCTECTSSEFPCDWCMEADRCTHDTTEYCRNDILITGVNRTGANYRSGPSSCSAINAINGDTEILVPAGTRKRITVKAHITEEFVVRARFQCRFLIEGRMESVGAKLVDDIVYCDAFDFTYSSKSPNVTGLIYVARCVRPCQLIDNPEKVHVVIYRCRDMAPDCGTCLHLPEKFNCGWCQSTLSCGVSDHCTTNGKIDWINRSQTCPS